MCTLERLRTQCLLSTELGSSAAHSPVSTEGLVTLRETTLLQSMLEKQRNGPLMTAGDGPNAMATKRDGDTPQLEVKAGRGHGFPQIAVDLSPL